MPVNDAQTTNRQHAVPQNVMDVEFKIIGDLTMRQFFYLGMAGIFAYSAYALIPITFIGYMAAGVILFIGLGLAFVPVQERGLDQWIINAFKAIYADNQSVWRKEPQELNVFAFNNLDSVRQELITLAPTSSRRKLEEYLDSHYSNKEKDPLDIDEMAYIKKVRTAFMKTTVTVEPEVAAAPSDTVVSIPGPLPQKTQPSDTPSDKGDETKKPPETAQVQKPAPVKPQVKPAPPKIEFAPLEPLTPDRHSGRRFTNLLPKQGEIILPIRGEKVLKTSEEDKIEHDIEEKAKNLKLLLEQIKREEGVSVSTSTKPSSPSPTPEKAESPESSDTNEVEKTISQLQKENQDLSQQIQRLQNEINQTNIQEEKQEKINTLTELQEKQERKQKIYENIQEEVSGLKEKVFVKKAITQPTQTTTPQDYTGKPNVITGKVTTSGGQGLEGVVLIIKNQRGEPVRALKTNKLGEFVISTPLSNGTYTIETDKTNKTELTFDIIEIEAKGEAISPIVINGK